jgi:tRNA A-37 threonylcarbamoyl transferase component Bud32
MHVESAADMVGELILGRFRIEAAIGSGGFGTVYRAWDERLERPVAVKVIESAEAAPRVMREAQAVARLAHRNIATLYELAGEGDRAYLVSELIDGETLRSLARRGELSDRLVADVGADSAAALVHAHRSGVVHRDVKPENVIVAKGGEAKLVDFGIARITGERTLTGTGDVLGTLAYMAPEQAEGQRPGPAADVYSLALTLYECLCGEHPLIRPGAAATARAIGEPIAPLAEVRPDLPAQMSEAIDAALDPDPELRPLASELEGALSAHSRELDGSRLPPVLRPNDDDTWLPRSRPNLERIAPALSVAALSLTALIVAGPSPLPVLLAAPLAGVLALGRPRAGLAFAVAVTVAWLLLGAGEPGAALLAALLSAPLLLVGVGGRGSSVALPGLAPLLGAAGLAPVYPALAGLTRDLGSRLLLGACGYLWLAAWEIASGKTLLLGAETAAPADWSQSAATALGDVFLPLLDPTVMLMAAAWALAAAVLPLLVRGRAPVMDIVGALIWAAGLISVHRVLAGPESEPAGLILAAVLAAGTAAFAAPRLRHAGDPPRPALAGDGATSVSP